MITYNRLQEVLDYNAGTGVFVWKKIPHESASNISVGDTAGYVENSGYRRIWIDGKRYVAQRLAWLYVYRSLPPGALDHIDCNKDNNSIGNLRPATLAQNRMNTRTAKNNHLRIKGVQLHGTGRYRARIYYRQKHVSLGLYDTPEEAQAAYAKAANELFGPYARSA